MTPETRELFCPKCGVQHVDRGAATLGIKRCWFHNTPSGRHYDIPKRRIEEIHGLTTVITPRQLLAIIKAKQNA